MLIVLFSQMHVLSLLTAALIYSSVIGDFHSLVALCCDVQCTVERLMKSGVAVKVSGQIQGFIQNLHMSDMPLAQPEKKFCVGKKLKCMVRCHCSVVAWLLILGLTSSFLFQQDPIVQSAWSISLTASKLRLLNLGHSYSSPS